MPDADAAFELQFQIHPRRTRQIFGLPRFQVQVFPIVREPNSAGAKPRFSVRRSNFRVRQRTNTPIPKHPRLSSAADHPRCPDKLPMPVPACPRRLTARLRSRVAYTKMQAALMRAPRRSGRRFQLRLFRPLLKIRRFRHASERVQIPGPIDEPHSSRSRRFKAKRFVGRVQRILVFAKMVLDDSECV